MSQMNPIDVDELVKQTNPSLHRRDRLSELIDSLNADSQWSPEMKPATLVQGHRMTELLVYGGRKTGEYHEFIELYGQNRVLEVLLPGELEQHLCAGDTFLMTLGQSQKSQRGWELLFCSHPYMCEEW